MTEQPRCHLCGTEIDAGTQCEPRCPDTILMRNLRYTSLYRQTAQQLAWSGSGVSLEEAKAFGERQLERLMRKHDE